MTKKKQGRLAEQWVLLELLRRDLDVYFPVVDDRGVDFLVRTGCGACKEIQVKGIFSPQHPRWFQVASRSEQGDVSPSLYIVGVEYEQKCAWVIPSSEFFRCALRSSSADGYYVFDLNLDTTPQGSTGGTRGERLKSYKDAWEGLI